METAKVHYRNTRYCKSLAGILLWSVDEIRMGGGGSAEGICVCKLSLEYVMSFFKSNLI